jgi:hypothetical protein
MNGNPMPNILPAIPQDRLCGRCGDYVYHTRKGRQRQRRYVIPEAPRTARQREKAENKGPELTAQVSQFQPITRSTSGTRRVHTVPAPSIRHVASGYARKFKARQLMLQMPFLQWFTQATSGRPRTNTGRLPEQGQCRAGSARVIGETGSPERLPALGKVPRNFRSLEMRRGG